MIQSNEVSKIINTPKVSFKLLLSKTWLIILLFTILGVYFGKLFYPQPSIYFTPEFQRSDVWHLNFPLKTYLGQSIKSGNIPLWNSKVGTGFPFLAEGQIGVFNLLNIIFFGFLPSWLAFNLSYIFIFILAFTGCYFLFYRNKISKFSSFIGAFVFSFSSFFIIHINHFAMIQAASYIPWVFLTAQNFWSNTTRRNLFYFIFVISHQFFSGHFQIFLVSIVGLLILFILLHKNKSPDFFLRKSIIFIITFIFILGIVGIQLFPTIELFAVSIRTSLISFSDITAFKSLKQLITLVFPYYFGSPADGSFPSEAPHPFGLFWESNFYIGIVPLIFSIIGLFKKRKSVWEKSILFLIICSFILSFGQNSPLGFIFFFPILSSMRGAGRFLVLTILGVSAFAAIGLDRWNGFLPNKNYTYKKITNLILFSFIFLDLYIYGAKLYPTTSVKNILNPPQILNIIPKGSRVYTDYSHYQNYYNKFINEGWNETDSFLYYRNALDEDSNILYGVGNINVYSAIPIIRQYLFLTNKTQDTLNISNVEYLISTKQLENQDFTLLSKINPPNSNLPEYFVYKNVNALARFRFISDYEVKKFDINDPSIIFGSNNRNITNSVIFEKDLNERFNQLKSSKIDIVKDDDRRIILNTQSDAKAILLMADTYYPGWKAKINGKSSEILPANISQRAIIVPSGENNIEIYYQPLSFFVGLLISISTLSFLIFGKKYFLKLGIKN